MDLGFGFGWAALASTPTRARRRPRLTDRPTSTSAGSPTSPRTGHAYPSPQQRPAFTHLSLTREGPLPSPLACPQQHGHRSLPQADLPGGSHAGLGRLLDRTGDIAGHEGHLPGASASLACVPVELVNGRVLRALD
ncbi:hypothetical protein [Streptomyces sp. NPDC057257]|uniref:hypothetical protein n=1 Tax=Streptomyces sp. NPDC057257 TaxID=3346071 RepID=UPI003642ADF6